MKSLLAVTLLLMSILPCVESGNFDELFNIGALTLSPAVPAGDKHVSKDAARIVEVELNFDGQYLMRIDPVEKCGRIVICAAAGNPCDKANDAIFLNPMGDKIIYEFKKGIPTGTLDKKVKLEDDNILIEFSTNQVNQVNQVTFTFNYRTGTEFTHAFGVAAAATKQSIRIETASFYCKVNVGTVAKVTQPAAKEFPAMSVPKTTYGSAPNTLELEPLRTGKSEPSKAREYFGPLFRRDSDSTCPSKDYRKCDGFGELELDTGLLCPHAHDWAGFSRWTEPINKVNQNKYNATFFKHPVYRYGLKQSTDNGCGTSLDHPHQIEIELNQVFDTTFQHNFHRCFGFALVFQKVDTTNQKLNLDPDSTFEFYLPAMMFIAPDTEKIRSLRISRSDLKKIRLSFYTDNNEDYAIVEYGFLNENIAGVREHISLTQGSIDAFKSVALFSEGYCEVRVLNARNDKTKESSEDLCMHLNGCDVFAEKVTV